MKSIDWLFPPEPIHDSFMIHPYRSRTLVYFTGGEGCWVLGAGTGV